MTNLGLFQQSRVVPLTKRGEGAINKMKMKTVFKEEEILREFRRQRGFKNSQKRIEVLKAFLGAEGHIDTQGLYDLLRKRGKEVGYSTVWRTLRLLVQAGLAREMHLTDKPTRFEHLYAHRHHDHLLCLRCGKTIEFLEPKIERLLKQVANRYNFNAERHSLILYGLCKHCR